MSRTLIRHVPIHPLQYPNQGQNYVFNGCMKFLMECVGEKNEQYDYWFFSAVSGDSFVQVFNTDKTKWSTCFSQVKFDRQMIQRVFDAVGYHFEYLAPEQWQSDKLSTKMKIMGSIDRGIPVIAKGFHCHNTDSGLELPTDEVSCVIGYEDDGQTFYRMTEEGTNLVAFTLDDPLPYQFVFTGDRKEAPPLASVYRDALARAPILMQTPPCGDGHIYFGNPAFAQWADALEGDFYRMDKAEYEAADSIASWRYYCVYVCILSTNIFAKQHTINRAIRQNPDLAPLAPLIDREYLELQRLEQELHAASGGFNVTYEVLQDAQKSRQIAQIIRQFPNILEHVCAIFSQI